MESDGLKKFLKTVGDTVYSLNTICVGLSAVSDGSAKKDEGLTISWECSNRSGAAAQSRKFVVRASLVFVEEALLNYLSYLKVLSSVPDGVREACSADGAVQKIRMLSKQVAGLEDYWEPCVILLIRWRNQVVHGGQKGLNSSEEERLVGNSKILAGRHSGIIIQDTIQNFKSGKITLKDFTTLISITIRYVRFLDSALSPVVRLISDLDQLIRQRNLLEPYNQILSVQNESKSKSKFQMFINTNFPSIDDEFSMKLYADAKCIERLDLVPASRDLRSDESRFFDEMKAELPSIPDKLISAMWSKRKIVHRLLSQ